MRLLNSSKMLFLGLSFLSFIACNESAAQSENSETTSKIKKVAAPDMDLQTAVVTGNLEAVKQHIAAGTDLNTKDAFTSSTPLITAATFDKREIAQALINAGADLSIQNSDGSSALHSAAFFGRVEIVQMLLDAKADKTLRNNYGATPKEMVSTEFSQLRPVYEMLQQQLAPMGLQLDLAELEKSLPVIAIMLQ